MPTSCPVLPPARTARPGRTCQLDRTPLLLLTADLEFFFSQTYLPTIEILDWPASSPQGRIYPQPSSGQEALSVSVTSSICNSCVFDLTKTVPNPGPRTEVDGRRRSGYRELIELIAWRYRAFLLTTLPILIYRTCRIPKILRIRCSVSDLLSDSMGCNFDPSQRGTLQHAVLFTKQFETVTARLE